MLPAMLKKSQLRGQTCKLMLALCESYANLCGQSCQSLLPKGAGERGPGQPAGGRPPHGCRVPCPWHSHACSSVEPENPGGPAGARRLARATAVESLNQKPAIVQLWSRKSTAPEVPGIRVGSSPETLADRRGRGQARLCAVTVGCPAPCARETTTAGAPRAVAPVHSRASQ